MSLQCKRAPRRVVSPTRSWLPRFARSQKSHTHTKNLRGWNTTHSSVELATAQRGRLDHTCIASESFNRQHGSMPVAKTGWRLQSCRTVQRAACPLPVPCARRSNAGHVEPRSGRPELGGSHPSRPGEAQLLARDVAGLGTPRTVRLARPRAAAGAAGAAPEGALPHSGCRALWHGQGADAPERLRGHALSRSIPLPCQAASCPTGVGRRAPGLGDRGEGAQPLPPCLLAAGRRPEVRGRRRPSRDGPAAVPGHGCAAKRHKPSCADARHGRRPRLHQLGRVLEWSGGGLAPGLAVALPRDAAVTRRPRATLLLGQGVTGRGPAPVRRGLAAAVLAIARIGRGGGRDAVCRAVAPAVPAAAGASGEVVLFPAKRGEKRLPSLRSPREPRVNARAPGPRRR